jgi:hypothetical protein
MTTELGAAVVTTAPAVVAPTAAAQRAAVTANTTVTDIGTAVADAVRLGVSIALYPVLALGLPLVAIPVMFCVLSINPCNFNSPIGSFIKAYVYLMLPAANLFADIARSLGLARSGAATTTSAGETADSAAANPADSADPRTTPVRATGVSKRHLTKAGETRPGAQAHVHQKLKAPAAQRNSATPGRAQAGSARKH